MTETLKRKFMKGYFDYDADYVEDFPMDSVMPMAFFYHIIHLVETFQVKDDYIILGFSLSHFEMLSEKQKKGLKKIQNEFVGNKNKQGDNTIFSLAIDENGLNSFIQLFTSFKKTITLHDLLTMQP